MRPDGWGGWAPKVRRPQPAPRWGVMFQDGSVAAPWNGRTQCWQARRFLADMRWRFRGDLITLAYRPEPDAEWVRV